MCYESTVNTNRRLHVVHDVILSFDCNGDFVEAVARFVVQALSPEWKEEQVWPRRTLTGCP